MPLLRLQLLAILIVPFSFGSEADDRLTAFFAREWALTLQENPTWAASLGQPNAPARWTDSSPEAWQQRVLHAKSTLQELALLTTSPELSPDQQLNAALFRQQQENLIAEHSAGLHLLILSPRSGIHLLDEHAASLRLQSVADFEHWIALLHDLPNEVDRTIALLQQGMDRGIVQPREVIERVIAPLQKQLPTRPQDSPFFSPLRKIPVAMPEPDRQRLITQALTAIREQVIPAYQRFHAFFTQRYLPACLPGIGAWRWPDGAAQYALLTRLHTTTSLTPEAIHQIGLSEVTRLLAELTTLKDELNFRGSLADFFSRLRTHPSFFYDSGPQLLQGYENLVEKIQPRLPKLFRTFPVSRLTVETIPAKSAPYTSTAYYRRPAPDGSRPGAFTVNLHAPHMRPKWEMMALTLHESVPGHHFQIALAQENTQHPEFRRHLHFSAFVEGWALYAEWLGYELNLYESPYDRLGQIVYDLWRSLRLVIDTGIHHHRWTRQQAIDYFLANAPKTELDITNEVDRYIAWPGQALAYKIGQLKIRELRTRAERAQGKRFDIRAFHDALLLGGTLPLDLLEKQINHWINTPTPSSSQ
jgi:uncharacterized protein (DUF885 family)